MNTSTKRMQSKEMKCQSNAIDNNENRNIKLTWLSIKRPSHAIKSKKIGQYSPKPKEPSNQEIKPKQVSKWPILKMPKWPRMNVCKLESV